jgi:ethanolamine ammonia-lyase small subunit
MKENTPPLPTETPQTKTAWEVLRTFTDARIALGRVGASLETEEVLKFGMAHAKARDAVHTPLDVTDLANQLKKEAFMVLQADSKASDRSTYLMRPDLGRQLHEQSRQHLMSLNKQADICFVLADGLSAMAVQSHAPCLLKELRIQWPIDWENSPVVIAIQGRVALGDAIAETFNAKCVIVFIGERPGLGSPDSLGVYLTYAPKIGKTDAERNCISNIRPQGLPYDEAAKKIRWLADMALQLKLSGVQLKDESDIVRLSS